MTFREKFEKECGTVFWSGCPHDHGYEERPSFYTHCASTTCEACWQREIEEKEQKPMKYKVGDTVLVQATIVDIDDEAPIEEWPIRVRFCYGEELRYNEEDLFELPKPDKTHEQGLEDAWELAKKIAMEKQNGGFDSYEIVDIFGLNDMDAIFMSYTPQEALAKLKAYEKEQEEKRKAEKMAKINVGDVVKYDGIQAVVMDMDTVGNVALFTENACIESWIPQCLVKKTSKNIDVESLLGQIKGDANE